MLSPVFVYGTLKRGLANHGWLAGQRFLGQATLPGAWLYDLGPFPMAVLTEADGPGVRGELFAVGEATLAALDRLEGTPRLFERQWLPLASGERAWVYLGRPRQVRHSPRIPSGCWERPGRADPGPAALVPALLGSALLSGSLLQSTLIPGAPAQAAPGNLELCRQWQRSRGAQRAEVANELGLRNGLTKQRAFAHPALGDHHSLYSTADLQRLCRNP